MKTEIQWVPAAIQLVTFIVITDWLARGPLVGLSWKRIAAVSLITGLIICVALFVAGRQGVDSQDTIALVFLFATALVLSTTWLLRGQYRKGRST